MFTILGWTVAACLAVTVRADIVTVDNVTDWNTTPMEIVNVNLPYMGADGVNVYSGINTLLITDGAESYTVNSFCIDPFHWDGISYPYQIVPLDSAPKPPAPLNAATATQIEDLWELYYSPGMSSPNAAGLQIAIWELVSSNAVANDGLPNSDAFSVNGYDYGASDDLASLTAYSGPAANLLAVTGPGQDFVFAATPVPDGGTTFLMLALTAGALVVARPALIKCAAPKTALVRVNRRSPRRRQAG
jgi:hypothetical protein